MEPRKRVNASGQRQHAVDDARISEGAPKAATARSSNVNSMTGEPTAAPDSMRLSRKAARIFALLLLFRLANAFLVVTFFQPDEYFQALEPAWAMVFGKQSGAWLTWVCTADSSPAPYMSL